MSGVSCFTELHSPIGVLVIHATVRGVARIWMQEDSGYPTDEASWVRDDVGLIDGRQQLQEYFSGARTTFDMPLDVVGTVFQRRVWAALKELDYGQTISYTQLASIIRRPREVRAAAAANGRNPIPIIIPCHRVIGSNGSLTGYSGGVERRQWLLAHQRATVAQ